MTIHSMSSMSGHTVVTLDTAEEIGNIKHFVVAPDVARIERLHIDGRRKNAMFAEWGDIESFGADRVMVAAAGVATDSRDDRDIDSARGSIELLGSRVLDTAGFEHGTVADASFDGDTGVITRIITTDGADVAADHVRSLGSYALVVDA